MRWPAIPDIERALKELHAEITETRAWDEVDPFVEIRLCLWASGAWRLNHGDVGYDLAHSDWCAASVIPRDDFSARELAQELIADLSSQMDADGGE